MLVMGFLHETFHWQKEEYMTTFEHLNFSLLLLYLQLLLVFGLFNLHLWSINSYHLSALQFLSLVGFSISTTGLSFLGQTWQSTLMASLPDSVTGQTRRLYHSGSVSWDAEERREILQATANDFAPETQRKLLEVKGQRRNNTTTGSA